MLGTEEHFFDLDFYDLLPNPNKFDECDPDLMLNQPPTQNIIRSAANNASVSLDDILQTAGWCSESTFAKYYKKPIVKENMFADRVLSTVK